MRRRIVLLAFGLFTIASVPTWAAEAEGQSASPAGKHVRLLAVGNSFSGNATHFLGDLVAASGGNRLTFAHASIGGCPLEKHVRLAEAFENDPRDPAARPYSGKASLRDLLQREKWDYVTIQQASIKSFELEAYRPWAKKLYDYIKRCCPQTEVLVHQTWAYREDDPLFRGGDFSADIMHQRLSHAYATIAGELGCRVIPVGDAFQAVRMLPAWRFNGNLAVDPRAYQYPRLPEQGRTLHAGWRWNTRGGSQRLTNDTRHAGVAGEYLGACVWFEFLYQQTVVGNAFVPRGLPVDDARKLQEIAHQVVAERARPQKQATARSGSGKEIQFAACYGPKQESLKPGEESKHHGRLPSMGFYSFGKKKSLCRVQIDRDDIPQDEKYHVYKVGRFKPLESDTAWAHWTWRCNVHVDNVDPNVEYEAYYSIKLEGPSYVKGPRRPDAFYFDRAVFVPVKKN